MKKQFIKLLGKWLKTSKTPNLNQSNTPASLTSLAPKILENEKELLRIKVYLDALKSAVNDSNIYNIAVTGAYGSGKSTILKTFQHKNPEYKYLNISLASFKEEAASKELKTEEKLERKLEISILQQIFYHVKPSQIPDSRFKRIINVTNKKLWLIALSLILWLISTITLFKFNYINKLDPSTWDTGKKIDFYFLLLLLIFSIGIGLFAKTVVRLFSNSKISKLNIKGELELGDNVDKSVFNQHLEEILYFFERTDFNVVVIEDLDRFESTDIFTKLREINILLNKSTVINRKIKFIYALRDEMFTDKNERVKFFEFIIPVIPFINPSNAGDQLTKLIADAKLQNVLSKEFTEDIVTFIDDIDMRLLINIFHEYCLYRENLSKGLNQDELFSMIIYKNMFPEDFGELGKRRGKLYKFITDKNIYTKEIIEKLQAEISEIGLKIQEIEAKWLPNIKELRTIYIGKILQKLPAGASLYMNKKLSFEETLEDENFKLISEQYKIVYSFFMPNYGSYNLRNNENAEFSFADVEKEISKESYKERERNIINMPKIEALKMEFQKKKQAKDEIETYTLKQIFQEENIEKYLSDFTDTPLLKNLFLNGYLNENYSDYISLFHEVNLTKEDFDFEKKIKSGVAVPYEYTLTKIENLIKKINIKYFSWEQILNYSLFDFILNNEQKYKTEHSLLFKLLSNEKDSSEKFIIGYIATGKKIPKFIRALCKAWVGFWNFINESNLTKEKVDHFLILILKYANIEDIKKFEQSVHNIVIYFESHKSIFGLIKNRIDYDLFIDLAKKLNLSFFNLRFPNVNEEQRIFDFIYKNNHYRINSNNIRVIIDVYSETTDTAALQSANFSTITSSNCPELIDYIQHNINQYVQDVLLGIPENEGEAESTIIDLLNNKELEIELKERVIEKQLNSVKDINTIDDFQIMQYLLNYNKVFPSWNNVIMYYQQLPDNVFDETLIDFLNEEGNFTQLAKVQIESDENDESFIDEFISQIMYNEGLSLQSYKALQKSIPYSYDTIDLEHVNKEKAQFMVESEFLNLTVENFEALRSRYSPLHILLAERHPKEFVNLINTITLTETDILSLLMSKELTTNSKIVLLKNVNNDFMISNSGIAAAAAGLIANHSFTFPFEIINSCFNAIANAIDKIKIINRYFDSLTDEQVQNFVESLGEEYQRIFMKQNKPVFSNTPLHKELFTKLKDRKLIIRFEEQTKHGDEIKVYANY